MYTWEGMRRISLIEARRLHESISLNGFYYLYPDGTEGEIDGYDWGDILNHYGYGGEIGDDMYKPMRWDRLTEQEQKLLSQDNITPQDVENVRIENLIEYFAICLYGRDGTVELERRLENEKA